MERFIRLMHMSRVWIFSERSQNEMENIEVIQADMAIAIPLNDEIANKVLWPMFFTDLPMKAH